MHADKSVAEKVRPRSAGNGGAADTTALDVRSVGHDLLHRERRVFRRRGSHRRADTAARRDGTRSLPARRRVEGRHRGQSEEGFQMDTQLQNTAGQDRVLRENAQQH